jgi:hypothetical protein
VIQPVLRLKAGPDGIWMMRAEAGQHSALSESIVSLEDLRVNRIRIQNARRRTKKTRVGRESVGLGHFCLYAAKHSALPHPDQRRAIRCGYRACCEGFVSVASRPFATKT